ncbi:MAG: HAD family phosphatase [Candidatus Symbiothrix sp.]|jgi:putative hydrolase of the HAD superfamily|nr:HAD family phosphatase [Candidatus Symbiothrix sp.]
MAEISQPIGLLSGVKNIVFDLGGVIVTLDHDKALRRFREAGVDDVAEYLNPYHQNGIFLDLEAGNCTKEEFYVALRKLTGKPIQDEAIDAGWLGFLKEVPIYKLKMLEDLHAQGYHLYLLSNTNPVVMEWALTPAFSSEGKPLDAYFDKLYLSFQMKCVKPDDEIFLKMIDDSNMIPSETLFIDDGVNNIATANRMGFKTYQATNGEDFRHLLVL